MSSETPTKAKEIEHIFKKTEEETSQVSEAAASRDDELNLVNINERWQAAPRVLSGVGQEEHGAKPEM